MIGSQLGQAKLLPSAEPTESVTPKPVPALNEPSPRKEKLVAEPEMVRPATLTVAPAEPKLTSVSVGPAPVLIEKFVAVSCRNDPRLIVSWSALKTNALKPLLSNWNEAVTAQWSLSGRSVIDPLTALPGRNWTPLDFTVIALAPPMPLWNETFPFTTDIPKWSMSTSMSLNTRMFRRLIRPAGATRIPAESTENPFE